MEAACVRAVCVRGTERRVLVDTFGTRSKASNDEALDKDGGGKAHKRRDGGAGKQDENEDRHTPIVA